jgi:antirestriction protein ArdC
MSRNFKSGPCGKRGGGGAEASRITIYAEVTDRIISELEAGRTPWVQPWSNAAARPDLPANAVTGRSYSGINILCLWGAVIEHGFAAQRWLTFAQARAAGGIVHKGEHGTQVVFANRFTPEGEKTRAQESGGDPKAIPFLKRFTVFNVQQIDGLPDALTTTPVPEPHEIIPAAEALVTACGADIRIGGSEAYYLPARDIVQLPPPRAFASPADFYATALHELGHYAARRIMPHGLSERWISADEPCSDSA